MFKQIMTYSTKIIFILSWLYSFPLSAEQPAWSIEEELTYYHTLAEKNQGEYALMQAALNAALRNQQQLGHAYQDVYYRLILDEIAEQSRLSKKWILLQEININSGMFNAYFIQQLEESGETLDWFYAKGSNMPQSHSREIQPPINLNNLLALAFEGSLKNHVDLAAMKFLVDGTLYYITASNSENINRIAVYSVESTHPTIQKLIRQIKEINQQAASINTFQKDTQTALVNSASMAESLAYLYINNQGGKEADQYRPYHIYDNALQWIVKGKRSTSANDTFVIAIDKSDGKVRHLHHAK